MGLFLGKRFLMDSTTLTAAITLATATLILVTRIVEYKLLRSKAKKPKKIPGADKDISKTRKTFDRFSLLSLNLTGVSGGLLMVVMAMSPQKPLSHLDAAAFLGLLMMAFFSVLHDLLKIREHLDDNSN